MLIAKLARCLQLLVLLFASAYAHAGVVVLDFEEVGGEVQFQITSKGFRISPSCHVDITRGSAYVGGPLEGETGLSMGYDQSGCPGPFASVRIDAFNQPFAITSFSFVNFDGRQYLRSSKGGEIPIELSYEEGDEYVQFKTVVVAGPEWVGIRWIEFGDSGAGLPAVFIDNVTLRVPVPTPGTLPLIAVAAVALLAFRSRAASRAVRRKR